MVRHTLSNTQSKAYKYLVASCFTQDVTPAEDITYDMNLPARGVPNVLSSRKQFLQESVKQKIVEIFQKHGGIHLATPLLMPKSIQHSNFTESNVKLMTRTGSVVSIPHDLRTPFARYIIWNNISHIRRYAIERVFRDKKVRCAVKIIDRIIFFGMNLKTQYFKECVHTRQIIFANQRILFLNIEDNKIKRKCCN